jgi:hypothetical protein
MRLPVPGKPAEPEPEDDYELTELEELAAHRTCRLLELGFSMEQVLRMAVYRPGFEWHVAQKKLADHTHEQVTWLLEE